MDDALSDRVADLSFKARALAQAHPLTRTAEAYRSQKIAAERASQPLDEFADWAATAFLVGYCIRRVEEADLGKMPKAVPPFDDFAALEMSIGSFCDDVRSGRPAGIPLFAPDVVEDLLDRVISTEIEKRVEHWKAQVTADDWAQFEQYIAWWVIHGYAMRAAETVGIEV